MAKNEYDFGALESISFIEKSLAQRIKAFGTQDSETVRQWKKLNTEYNVTAMKLLKDEDYDTALDLLNRAKELTTADVKFGEADDRKKLLAITYNNMSCIYKRRGLLKTALNFAEKALKLESSSSKADNPACTHLNLSAILSKLDRHRHALEHCKCALELLKTGNFGGMTPGLMNDFADSESSILAVCYHNLAVEHEHLHEWDKSIQAYMKSVEVAAQELGPDHPITMAFEGTAQEAQESLELKKMQSGKASKKKVSDFDRKLMGVGKTIKTPRGL